MRQYVQQLGAKHSADKPTLIVCKTAIGKGSPNRAGTSKAHGEPLGAEEIKLTREALGWTAEPFKIPKEVYADWDAKAAGRERERERDGPGTAQNRREVSPRRRS